MIKDLVSSYRNQAFTTSLKVAEVFEKDHFHVVRDIEDLIAQMASASHNPILVDGVITPLFQNEFFKPVFKKSSYKAEAGGRNYPLYLINRDAFTLLVSGFSGTKALMFKAAFITEFNRMEAELATIKANKADPEWQLIRLEATDAYKRLAAAVKDFVIPVARLCGSSTDDFMKHFPECKKTHKSIYNAVKATLYEFMAISNN